MGKKSKNVPNLIETANEPVINDDLCLREKIDCVSEVYSVILKDIN